jgi:hypothetical protein
MAFLSKRQLWIGYRSVPSQMARPGEYTSRRKSTASVEAPLSEGEGAANVG